MDSSTAFGVPFPNPQDVEKNDLPTNSSREKPLFSNAVKPSSQRWKSSAGSGNTPLDNPAGTRPHETIPPRRINPAKPLGFSKS